MRADEFTESAEKLIAGFERMASDLLPTVKSVMKRIDRQRIAFEKNKKQIEKEIESGARTTKHRLHL